MLQVFYISFYNLSHHLRYILSTTCQLSLQKQLPEYCRKCNQKISTEKAPSQTSFISNATQKRWKYYPDLTAKLSSNQIRDMMMNEYNHNCIIIYLQFNALKENTFKT